MANAPVFDIDFPAFKQNPYPILENMRHQAPIAYVPALGAVLISKRCLLYTSPSPRDPQISRMPSSA